MDPSDCEDGEQPLHNEPNKCLLTWQLKALLAGRIPLPTSRPKRAEERVESTEPDEANSTSEENDSNTPPDDPDDDARDKDEKERSVPIQVVVSANRWNHRADERLTYSKAKKPKICGLRCGRKQWKHEEIRRLVDMRKNKMTWEEIVVGTRWVWGLHVLVG